MRKLLIILLLASCFSTLAQTKSNKGKLFWLGFMAHTEGTDAGTSLYITSDSNTTGTVSVPGKSWSTNFTVTANNLTVVTIPSSVTYDGCADCTKDRAVKVTSADNVIVYAHHYEGNRSDATLVLPASTLGKEYYAMGYEQSSSGNSGRNVFIIVGTKDNTKVNITPSVDLRSGTGGTLQANTKYQITLNEGEVYQGIARQGSSTYDVTGTFIEVIDTGSTANCRTVAVFSGSSYTRIGNCSGGWGTFNSGDNLFEQMFPTNSWGKNFVIVPALGRKEDNFRFLARDDNTQVYVYKTSGAPDILYLDEGEMGEIKGVDYTRGVLSNKPIMVAQFQKTSRCDGNNRVGDPSMTILNPLEQTLKDITLYSSEYYDIDNHYINVVIPTSAASSFRIDGSAASFTSVPLFGAYSYARLTVNKGTHRLKADAGFIATAYGEGQYESYGYAAGANVKDLRASIVVANSAQSNEISNCLGQATDFRGNAEYSVTKWEWDFGDGNIDSVQNPNHVYSDTGLYQARLYTYKPAYDGCSNYDSAFIDVRIYAPPVAKFATGPLCDSSVGRYYDSSFIPAPEEWNFTKWIINGGTPKYSKNTSQYFDTTGKFEVIMEVSTKHQCRDTITDSVTISPNPSALFTVADACHKDSAYFVNTSFISSGNLASYKWYFGDGDSSILANPAHKYSSSDYYYIDLIATSDSGCVGSYMDSVYCHPYFKAQFSFNDTCLGLPNTFNNTSVIFGGDYTDTTWYTSENDTFTTYNLTKTFATPGSYTIDLIMEQDSYCLDTFSQTIDVHNLATVDFEVSESCFGDSTTFTDKSTITTGTYTLDWDFDDGFTGDKTVEKVLYTTSGAKNIELKILTDEGCETSLGQSIVITKPEITSIIKTNMCSNESQKLYATYSLGLDSFISNSWRIDGIMMSTSDTLSYVPSSAGIKYVELTSSTKNNCTVVFLDSFEVYASPSTNFFVVSVCKDQDLLPTNNSTIDIPEIITSNKWYLNNVLVSSDPSPTITTTVDGSNTLRLVTESSNGCLDSITKSFGIHPLPQVDFLIGATCFGESTVFNDNSTINSGTNNTYSWEIEATNPSGISTSYTFGATGNYNVKETVISDKGCTDTLTKVVTIDPLPVLDISFDDYEGCEPFSPNVINNSNIESGSIDNYAWNFGDGNSTSGANPTHTYLNPGSFTVKVIATSDQGCIDSFTLGQQVTVQLRPTADFNFDPKEPSVLIAEVTFKDSSSSDATSWNWTIGDGTTLSGSSVSHTFNDSGAFAVELKIENSNGCRDSITKSIYVNADLFVHIPNAFSPDGNGVNDYFGIGGLTQGVVDLTLTVYNRWGEKIFETNDVNDKWDGTYKGTAVPQGVYLYKAKFTNPKQSKWFYKSGEIHLLK